MGSIVSTELKPNGKSIKVALSIKIKCNDIFTYFVQAVSYLITTGGQYKQRGMDQIGYSMEIYLKVHF